MQRRTFLKAAGTAVLGGFAGEPAVRNGFAALKQGNFACAPSSFQNIIASGELHFRAMRNFDRLEESRYQPERVFISDMYTDEWPGDTEGRTVLALTLLAQSARREPRYLDRIIELFPEKMNTSGYFGKIYPDGLISEQQLSGHGWTLRGLCEYYEWRRDERVLRMIERIVDSLVLPTRGAHENYPIDPAKRQHGGSFSGTEMKQVGQWILSTDIGCDFIFLDGIAHAYKLLPSPALKSIVEEIITLYRRMDLRSIKAQTHASLTGMRALIRFFELTGNREYLDIAENRYTLYRQEACTENFENYNWFGRPEWTEPCAVIDSFMVAFSLWRYSGNPAYLEDAHHIYYNGIAHEQHANGGFGLNNCTGAKHPFLSVEIDEAYWCCTMRGGEGLSRAVQYAWCAGDNTICLPFFHPSSFTAVSGEERITLALKTDYPDSGGVELAVRECSAAKTEILLFNPSWFSGQAVYLNGSQIPFERQNGFLSVALSLHAGDVLRYDFQLKLMPVKTHNPNSIPGYHRFEYGPLILGHDGEETVSISRDASLKKIEDKKFQAGGKDTFLSPIIHLLDPLVKKGDGYRRQILFR